MTRSVFARFYARVSPSMDRGGVATRRRQLLAGLSGRVIEVGAGNGLNLAHYPPEVTELLAVQPEPLLRRIAGRAAEAPAAPVHVMDGRAERLQADDERADAAVASQVHCSVADPHTALAEIRRVLKPGGQLRFLEHVRADSADGARLQEILDVTVWPRLFGGCHAGRDIVAAVSAAGLDIQRLDRFRFPEDQSRHPPPSTSSPSPSAARSAQLGPGGPRANQAERPPPAGTNPAMATGD